MNSKNTLVKFSEVRRNFDGTEVLHDLSFCLHSGEVLAMVGPNGAGKTTTVRLLLGLLRCHSGEVTVLGSPSWSMSNLIRMHIGVILEYNGLYGNMTAKQNLLYFGQLSGLSKREINTRITKTLSYVGFEDDLNKLVSKLSKGNRQKVAISRALMNKPKLLVLDEPTSGLDPISQRDVRKMIVQLADEKQTALLVTSHNMAEVAFIANKVLILKTGKNIAFGTPDEFIKKCGYVFEVNLKNNNGLSDAVCILKERVKWNKIEKISATRIQVYTNDEGNDEGNIDEKIKSVLLNAGFVDTICTKRYPTLEESYCHLMEK